MNRTSRKLGMALGATFVGAVVAWGVARGLGVLPWVAAHAEAEAAVAPRGGRWTLADIPFDGQKAYEYLQAICDLGPRPSGSAGMANQQQMLIEHFRGLGATVERQDFRIRHPRTGAAVPLSNLIVRWHPERKERILLAAHYDTRPFPDQDPSNPRGRFVGANDGASGVAVLMELGREMAALDGRYGVDFVLFDGEEFVFDDRDAYFLGSTHFAQDYAGNPPEHRYRMGVLLDMVGDADQRFYYDVKTLQSPGAADVARSVWGTARRLGVGEFVPQRGFDINDDHVPLNNIARIPTCDVIDFEYPYWHTTADVPEKCSPLSLAKVGWVMSEWLKQTVGKQP